MLPPERVAPRDQAADARAAAPFCRKAPSFGSFIDDALRLADRALDAADSHIDGNADVGLDAVLQPCGAGIVSFHQNGQMVERPLPGNLERVMRAEPRLLEDQLLDLRREQVD